MTAKEINRPNIVVICADQMRGDTMGCAGHPVVDTPNLDRLAACGTLFDNAYTPCPVCVPARATLTTGNYPHKCGVAKVNRGGITDDQLKLAGYFSRHGYVSYAAGKLHYLPYSSPETPRVLHGFDHAALAESGRVLSLFDPMGEKRGIEDYHDYLHDTGWGGYARAHGVGNNDIHPAPSVLPSEHYVDSWVCSKALDYLDLHMSNDKNKPFFAFISFPKPHAPYDPPRPYDTLYDPREVPAPFEQRDTLPRTPTKFREGIIHGWNLVSPETHRVTRAYYYGMISFQDKQVGRILDFLEKNGLAENTIVIYLADHGEMLGDFGFFAKSCFYRGSVNIPMIIKAPGMAAGDRSDALIGLQDVLPTLASMAGLPLDRDVDGMDFSPLLKGESFNERDFYVSYFGDDPRQSYMIADKEYKYIYSQVGGTEEFYDLANDPEECSNIAGIAKYADAMAEKRRQLIDWMIHNDDTSILHDGSLLKTQKEGLENCKFEVNSLGLRWY